MIERKLKTCNNCNQQKYIWARGRCKSCDTLLKKPKPIAKISAAKSKEDKIYATLRKVFLSSKPICEAKVSGCSTESTEVHHKQGRGIRTNVVTTWLAVCRNCHHWIEMNPEQAKELGYSENRI